MAVLTENVRVCRINVGKRGGRKVAIRAAADNIRTGTDRIGEIKTDYYRNKAKLINKALNVMKRRTPIFRQGRWIEQDITHSH